MENKAYAPVKGLPAWHAQLHDELNGMADALTAKLTGWQGAELVIRPEEKGWRGEGKATEAIQQAVDEVCAQGGGTLLLDGGDYVTGCVTTCGSWWRRVPACWPAPILPISRSISAAALRCRIRIWA